MKICVYAIAKNEEAFVDRFAASAREADCIIVADTGSDDRTAQACRDNGIIVHDLHVAPWRFDIARNAAFALVPRDVDISLDLDEVMEPGWREEIGRLWTTETTRIRRQLLDAGMIEPCPTYQYLNSRLAARYLELIYFRMFRQLASVL